MSRPFVVLLGSPLLILAAMGQATKPAGVVADKMEIPRYPPLAAQARVSGEVTLSLRVKTNGDVVSTRVVSAHSQSEGWARGFVDEAATAAKLSKFSCRTCEGSTFEHELTYQFQYPVVPKDACEENPTRTTPQPPPSTTDSSNHVTVRPNHWPCVMP